MTGPQLVLSEKPLVYKPKVTNLTFHRGAFVRGFSPVIPQLSGGGNRTHEVGNIGGSMYKYNFGNYTFGKKLPMQCERLELDGGGNRTPLNIGERKKKFFIKHYRLF